KAHRIQVSARLDDQEGFHFLPVTGKDQVNAWEDFRLAQVVLVQARLPTTWIAARWIVARFGQRQCVYLIEWDQTRRCVLRLLLKGMSKPRAGFVGSAKRDPTEGEQEHTNYNQQ